MEDINCRYYMLFNLLDRISQLGFLGVKRAMNESLLIFTSLLLPTDAMFTRDINSSQELESQFSGSCATSAQQLWAVPRREGTIMLWTLSCLSHSWSEVPAWRAVPQLFGGRDWGRSSSNQNWDLSLLLCIPQFYTHVPHLIILIMAAIIYA